jgi:hypothetical protein
MANAMCPPCVFKVPTPYKYASTTVDTPCVFKVPTLYKKANTTVDTIHLRGTQLGTHLTGW